MYVILEAHIPWWSSDCVILTRVLPCLNDQYNKCICVCVSVCVYLYYVLTFSRSENGGGGQNPSSWHDINIKKERGKTWKEREGMEEKMMMSPRKEQGCCIRKGRIRVWPPLSHVIHVISPWRVQNINLATWSAGRTRAKEGRKP